VFGFVSETLSTGRQLVAPLSTWHWVCMVSAVGRCLYICRTTCGLIYSRHHHTLYRLSWTPMKVFVLLWDQTKYCIMC